MICLGWRELPQKLAVHFLSMKPRLVDSNIEDLKKRENNTTAAFFKQISRYETEMMT